jgi:hypothetical protein
MSVTIEDARQGLTLVFQASGELYQAQVHRPRGEVSHLEIPLLNPNHPLDVYSFMLSATFAGSGVDTPPTGWAGNAGFSSAFGPGEARLLTQHGTGLLQVEPGFASWELRPEAAMPVLRVRPAALGLWTFHRA